MTLSRSEEYFYLGICLTGFFFGLHSGIFVLYLQCHASKTDSDDTVKGNNILFYALCLLYVLSVAIIVNDIVSFATTTSDVTSLYAIYTIQFTLFACCDFIAQSILIYRCWIVWGQNIRVVIVPSILTFVFLATWLASITPKSIVELDEAVPAWSFPLTLTSLAASMSVNALATGLIVFRIFQVFRRVKPTSDEQTLGATGGPGRNLYYSIISVIIESGAVLFSVQLARFVITLVQPNAAKSADYAYQFIVCIHEILNGITPTIILVRVSLGLSFYDETLMSEATETLRFGSDHPTSEMGGIGQETRNDDNNIQLQ